MKSARELIVCHLAIMDAEKNFGKMKSNQQIYVCWAHVYRYMANYYPDSVTTVTIAILKIILRVHIKVIPFFFF